MNIDLEPEDNMANLLKKKKWIAPKHDVATALADYLPRRLALEFATINDVTGHLVGYKFQWAWSSGFVAGRTV